MPNALLIGDILREIRLAKEMTQEKLATDAGLKTLTISKIENNRQGVSKQSMEKLASAVGVPVSFFLLLSDQSDDPLVHKFQQIARKTLDLPAT